MFSEPVIEDSGATLEAPVVKGNDTEGTGLETVMMIGATEPVLLPVPPPLPD